MTDRIEIARRIKDLRAKMDFPQSFVAQKLFVSQSAYSLMENAQNGINSEHLLRLSKLFSVTADFLLSGNNKLIEMNYKNGFIPLINARTHAGFLKNMHKEDVMDDFEYYRVPGFNPTKDSYLIENEGSSMEPTVMSGDILICQTQHKLERVLDGSIVILVTKDAILTKRIYKHDDDEYFWTESDNPNEERKKEIKKRDIDQLLMVMGKVSNVLIPHREMAFKGKMQFFEESLGALSKEVYQLNKKLNKLKPSHKN
ncbi:XRE family transcriptional regulator [Autumnicola musiva]|uniref:S24 family peptidase n=1 Tax=Autumnicola musiva TaxID=3075589 RepID=A0ABU3D221_9FLAO|nr:S24 family peptidase [Zunongwangia sp. F117]MDT0675583.1 S24 family peptidase [Zunongwangia sp. F117]